MHTFTPENSIFGGPITNLLSILHILIEILSRVHTKVGKTSFNDFIFGTFVGRFPSDSKASMAVKGLNGHSSTQDGCIRSVHCYSGPGYISWQ